MNDPANQPPDIDPAGRLFKSNRRHLINPLIPAGHNAGMFYSQRVQTYPIREFHS